MLFLVLLFYLSVAKRDTCHILEYPEYHLLSQDVIIGAVISMCSGTQMQHTEKPPFICIRIYDHCSLRVLSVKAALTLIYGSTIFEDKCSKHGDLLPFNEDISELRYAESIYSAESSVVHSLHSQKCEQPWQVDEFLKEVVYIANVRKDGLFDSPGAKAAKYAFAQNMCTGGKRKTLWMICSESCPPRTRKDALKGRPTCSYDCIPHAVCENCNHTDPYNCEQCPEEYWFNAVQDKCVLKVTEFLSHTEVMRIILLLFIVFGAVLTVLLLIEKYTPIIKINNSGLNFLLLFSLCFLCSLTFIGRSSQWSCMLRHTAFGATLTFSISCVLGEPVIVLIAFRATLPVSNANHSKKQTVPICKHKINILSEE